ncbi:unnamed protein product [Amoebophrya sp. A25]|nr:unnamed protein product [Amoebophrya sp. A25]|eukprot:GSA25T00009053001.1
MVPHVVDMAADERIDWRHKSFRLTGCYLVFYTILTGIAGVIVLLQDVSPLQSLWETSILQCSAPLPGPVPSTSSWRSLSTTMLSTDVVQEPETSKNVQEREKEKQEDKSQSDIIKDTKTEKNKGNNKQENEAAPENAKGDAEAVGITDASPPSNEDGEPVGTDNQSSGEPTPVDGPASDEKLPFSGSEKKPPEEDNSTSGPIPIPASTRCHLWARLGAFLTMVAHIVFFASIANLTLKLAKPGNFGTRNCQRCGLFFLTQLDFARYLACVVFLRSLPLTLCVYGEDAVFSQHHSTTQIGWGPRASTSSGAATGSSSMSGGSTSASGVGFGGIGIEDYSGGTVRVQATTFGQFWVLATTAWEVFYGVLLLWRLIASAASLCPSTMESGPVLEAQEDKNTEMDDYPQEGGRHLGYHPRAVPHAGVPV